jgi:hypothetical protein
MDTVGLMIGNYVQHCGKPKKVVKLGEAGEVYLEGVIVKNPDHIQPIEVTEEWLEKLGFLPWCVDMRWSKPFENDINYDLTTKTLWYRTVSFPVHTVHELQNMHYWLYGRINHNK